MNSFSQRGAYRRREPVVDQTIVLEVLENAGISSHAPRQQIDCRIVWNKLAWDVVGKPLNNLSEPQQERLRLQADAVAEAAGWRIAAEEGSRQSTTYYARPLAPSLEGARQALAALLADYGGYPVRADTVQAHAERGAYGRSFYGDDLDPALVGLVRQLLREHGYEPEPDEREYRPRPASMPENAAVRLQEALAALEPVQTDFGPGLLRDTVLETAGQALDLPQLGDWQAEQLLATGPLGAALSRLGYRREATWRQPDHFRPPLEDDGSARQARQVLLREIRITRDPERKLSLASGLPVYTPAVVLDPDNDGVVYLEMVGSKQAVRANWAALAGGRVQWIGRQRIELDGMKNHALVQTALPCGWLDAVLIHKQASLQVMQPEEPFYLLDSGDGQIPPLFYPMLNKCLAIPLLEVWSGYLWARGREQKLVELLNDGEGQGYAAWRVLPAPEAWQRVVQEGLSGAAIDF